MTIKPRWDSKSAGEYERQTKLSYDIARCRGARVDNDVDQALMIQCMECRRAEIPNDPNVRYLLITPPLFKGGVCPKQIKEEA
jgi:hypothetical protein